MQYCQHCGAQVTEDQKVCLECGKSLKEPEKREGFFGYLFSYKINSRLSKGTG